jgi:hypothetical protein
VVDETKGLLVVVVEVGRASETDCALRRSAQRRQRSKIRNPAVFFIFLKKNILKLCLQNYKKMGLNNC